jgi:YYY domain-containing protein
MLPLSDIFAAFRWWLALMILGAAVWPLSYTVLGRLPDRGYAFTKMAGLLLVAYLFWLLGSLGLLGNDLGGALVALGLVTGLSLWVYGRRFSAISFQPSAFSLRPLLGWLRDNGRYVMVTELVFGLVFLLWVWVRAQNPAIEATEKPMEFAFLNGVGRSAFFPPLDPWLSGYAISYYYFGYVMTSLLGRLAFVAEPVAFNLAIAWLTAGTAVGAFGLVYNLIMSGANQESPRTAAAGDPASETSAARLRRRQRRSLGWPGSLQRHALLFGLVAALALPLAGNLQILMEILHANRVGSTEFWTWLDVRDINTEPPEVGATPRYQSFWWWWRSSRVIREYHLSGEAVEGLEPIAEFPAFSFVLGDLHPHVLALPFAFLSLAVALAWWRQPWPAAWPRAADGRGAAGDGSVGEVVVSDDSVSDGANGERTAGSVGSARRLFTPEQVGLWGLTVVVLGGLAFLNTWDVLIHLFVIVAAFALALWRDRGRWDTAVASQAAIAALLLAVPALLLYLPFYLGFRSQAGPPFILPMLMRPTRLVHFLIIFGMPLLGVVVFLATLVARQRFRHWQTGLSAAVSVILALTFLTFVMGWVIAASQEGAWRVIDLAHRLNVTLPLLPAEATALYRLRWGLAAVLNLAPTFLAARIQYAALTLLLATLLGLAVMALATLLNRDHGAPDKPEAAILHDRRSPLAFVLLLVVAGALLTLAPEFIYLYDVFGMRLNTIFKFYYQAWVLFGVAALFGLSYLMRQVRSLGLAVTAAYGLLLAIALLFPVYAVSARAQEFRGPAIAEQRAQPTLNGLAHVARHNPDEYAALMWLRENVTGTPVILEAVGGSYTGYGRVSAGTGLPTVLGWPGHQHQWRGTTREPARREPAVETIYSRPDWDQTMELLNRYQVAYIYVGGLERSSYGLDGLAKFEQSLPVAYANGSVTIYRWQP